MQKYNGKIVERLKENATELEGAYWTVKCDKHLKSGGQILHNGGIVEGKATLSFDASPQCYAIIKEPKYRPYKTVEEVPVGQPICDTRENLVTLIESARIPYSDQLLRISTSTYGNISAESLLNLYKFKDGTPCGIPVTEDETKE